MYQRPRRLGLVRRGRAAKLLGYSIVRGAMSEPAVAASRAAAAQPGAGFAGDFNLSKFALA